MLFFASNILGGTVCIFNAVTGLPCFLCGITRAVMALLNGDIAASLAFFPPLLPLIFMLLAWIVLRKNKKAQRNIAIAAFILILTVYIVRIFLYFPHTEPMTVNYSGILPRIIGFLV